MDHLADKKHVLDLPDYEVINTPRKRQRRSAAAPVTVVKQVIPN